MFVTSKRCFINCLAQFMDYEQLSQANYYVIDVNPSSTRYTSTVKTVEYMSDGTPVVREKEAVTGPSVTRFHIVYSEGYLDPTVGILQMTTNASNVNERDYLPLFQKYLSQPETIGNVYNWFYGSAINRPRGNGLMIIIINTEDHVRIFGHTICEFLANYIGEDVEFVDAQFRPQIVPGYQRYKGNKAFAEKILRDQRDYQLLSNFMLTATQMGYQEGMQNLTALLSIMDPPDLMHLYELAFPNDPLPPGNYTTDHIKKVLIGKAMDLSGTKKSMPNLHTSNVYLDQLTDEIDRLGRY